MFILKKLIASLLMPLSVVLIFLWAGWWLTLRPARLKLGRAILLLGILTLTLASNRGVGILLLRPLESRYHTQPDFSAGGRVPQALAECKAIIVLGGGHSDTPGLPPGSRLSASALARIVEGCRLASALPHAQLWTSGPSVSAHGTTHAALLAEVAVQLGVSRDRIRRIETGYDTEGEARAVAKMLGTNDRIALVTSAWHMPRAVGLFSGAGIKVVPCPTDYAVRFNPGFNAMDYLGCDMTGLERTQRAIYEYLGFTWALLRGKLQLESSAPQRHPHESLSLTSPTLPDARYAFQECPSQAPARDPGPFSKAFLTSRSIEPITSSPCISGTVHSLSSHS